MNTAKIALEACPTGKDQDERTRELIKAYLVHNHSVDVVKFCIELFAVASEVGEIKAKFNREDDTIQFQIGNQTPWPVTLERGKSKFRMLCAHLAVVAQEQSGSFVNIYGDDATFEMAIPEKEQLQWHVRTKNTTDCQEFTITHIVK
jgi:hypothetical protein